MAVSIRFVAAPPAPEELSATNVTTKTILQIAPCLSETGKRLLDAGELYQLFLALIEGTFPIAPINGVLVIAGPGNVALPVGAQFVPVRQAVPQAINITLPPRVVAGSFVIIKDSLGVCFAHNFTINTSDGTLIDLLPTYVFVNAFQGQQFTFDGTGWGVT